MPRSRGCPTASTPGAAAEFVENLGKTIGDRKLTVFEGGAAPALALVAAENAAAKMTVKVLRTTGGVAAGVVRAIDAKGSPIGEARYAFGMQDRESEAAFDLPVELRNDISRLEISGERSAGAVQLLDKRWRRRAVGVVTGATSDTAQPLLASTFYLTRALSPFADMRLGDRGAPQQVIAQFLDQRLPMIVLADVGTLSPEIRERLNAWIDQGGVLLRFAGPRLAQADDDLVPVKLRRGGRTLGGSLTWEKPQHLASFAADGPFAGLAVPKDITVNRQVLAEPDAVLATKTWASLEDGTPLVTGEHRGKGIVSLFHVGADSRWSDLPMSGSFVEMLRRMVDMSGYTAKPGAGVASETTNVETVAPLRTLDGFGAFGPPPSTAKPMPADYRDRATSDHPPGFYGPADGPIAVNTLAPADRIAPLDTSSLARTARQLHQRRAARSARHPAVVVAGAVPDRCDRGRDAGRGPCRPVAAAHGDCRRFAGADPIRGLDRAVADAAQRQRRVRHQGGVADAPCLCRHRKCRRRFHRQGRHGRTDAVPGAAHGAGSRRSRRRRSRARRTGVLSADLLADRAGRAEAAAGRHQPHRRLHEAGRHGAVRHPRRHRGAARRERRGADAGHAARCAKFSPPSTCPNSSRCRASTC